MIEQYLIEAYRTTKYKVPFLDVVINIDELNTKLDEVLRNHILSSWAFITAYNPFSETLSGEQNEFLHQNLIQLVQPFIYYEGYGVGEDPAWSPEKSLLVFGITRDKAIKLGNTFKQNAIVFGHIGVPAELVLLR